MHTLHHRSSEESTIVSNEKKNTFEIAKIWSNLSVISVQFLKES